MFVLRVSRFKGLYWIVLVHSVYVKKGIRLMKMGFVRYATILKGVAYMFVLLIVKWIRINRYVLNWNIKFLKNMLCFMYVVFVFLYLVLFLWFAWFLFSPRNRNNLLFLNIDRNKFKHDNKIL